MIGKIMEILKIVFKRIYGILISVLFLILSHYLFFELGESILNKTGRHYRGRLLDGVFLKIEDAIPNSKYFLGMLFFYVGGYIMYLIFKRIILEIKEGFSGRE
tara:strand:+ start:12712 stop:13020 length:309 start_codon:yes stop_codon:yes gene_type:complete